MRMRRLVLSRPDLGAGQAPPHRCVHSAQVHPPRRRLSHLRNVFLIHLLKARAQALLQLCRALQACGPAVNAHADRHTTHMWRQARHVVRIGQRQ